MISEKLFRQTALSFPGTSEQPHFEKTSFRVGWKIFATLDTGSMAATLKLPIADQDIFSTFDKTIIYPVQNKWGQKGWTYVDLKKVRKDMLVDALTSAYRETAPQKLSALLNSR